MGFNNQVPKAYMVAPPAVKAAPTAMVGFATNISVGKIINVKYTCIH